MLKNPFFILGVQRSGTTLLSVMLEKHSAVMMESRVVAFRLITCFQNIYRLLPHNLEVDRKIFLAWLAEHDHKGQLKDLLDLEHIDKYKNIRSFIEASIEKKLREHNREIWGDKAPNLQHYIPDILALIPNAKFIHIVRDGRACASSMSKRTYKNLSLSAQQWVDGSVLSVINQDLLGEENYMIVYYESLLKHPEQSARKICAFLDIPYDPTMIELSDNDRDRAESYVKNYFDTSKIDDWKKKLSTIEIRKIETIQGPLLSTLGYELSDARYLKEHQPLSLRQRIMYNQWDQFKLLFKGKRKGMKDKQLVDIHVPLKMRIHAFFRFLYRDYLSTEIFQNRFSHFFYKKKKYKK